MPQPTMTAKLQFLSYRFSTVLKSFKTLYTLPKEKVDAFVDSYNVFDYDWANDEKLIAELGSDYYKEVKKRVIDYYSVLNHLCSLGQVEKMYIPPAIDLSVSIIENQKLFEKKMMRDLGIKKGDKGLDVGCGRGRVASHVATETGAQMTGMNIDATQLEAAKRFALGKGLAKQCEFRIGDMNDLPLPFADNSFDFMYQIQAFSYAKDPEKLFKELHRVLKPGKRLSFLDWFYLDKYDGNNPQHIELMKRIKPLIGAIGTPSVDRFVKLLENAGFEIVVSENASIDGLQAPLIENADKFFTRMKSLVKFFVRCKVLPKHFEVLFERLTKDGEAFVEADRLRLVTTSYHIVAQKKA